MSYIHRPLKKPLEHRLPFQLLRTHSATHPNKEAFVFRDVKKHRIPITFQQYDTTSQSLAKGLLEIGLKRGDRVLLMVNSCPEFVYIHMALNRIGAIVIVSEENFLIALEETKNFACAVLKSDFSSSVGQQTLKEIHATLAQRPGAKAVLIGCEVDHSKHERIVQYNDLFVLAKNNPDSQSRLELAQKQVLMDDPFTILFTSGSTGQPKPIEYTNHVFINKHLPYTEIVGCKQESRLFTDCPLDWEPGMMVSIVMVIVHGCTSILFPPKIGFKGGFTSLILETIAEEKCTATFLLPFFYYDMINQGIGHVDLTSVNNWVTGGQHIGTPLIRKLLDILPQGTNFTNEYGCTEAGMIARQKINKENIDDVNAIEMCDGYEAKIIDEKGQLVPIGEKGELCLRAPWIAFPNYDMLLSSQNKTKPQTNNWHHMGDLCSFDRKQQITIYGRIDHLIKCATESIHPIEIEQVLCKHPDVDKICACGVPDQRFYNKICACMIMKEGKKGDQASFQKWSEENFEEMSSGLSLAPHYYVFLDSFPLTKSGKLCRKQTKQLAIKMLGLA